MCTRLLRHDARQALAALCLGLLLTDAGLPLATLAVAADSSAYCCAAGRCCCKRGEGEDDERGCIRRACGCGRPDAVTFAPLLRVDALLPAADPLEAPEPVRDRAIATDCRLLTRPDEPPVPPPKPALPA